MLKYDPIPWLMAQDGLPAIRARRILDLDKPEDEVFVLELLSEINREKLWDGSFSQSPIKTAGVLNLLDDLKVDKSDAIITSSVSYLFSVLESQPGYEYAKDIKPGSLDNPCDLGGFFGPYEDRGEPDVVAYGAREMNFYRKYEPLLGPKNPVRSVRRSSLDRVGPSSCYSWGLIPLCYTIEAICRAGYAHDERLQPAVNVLLGVQRVSGGWCRNLGGHPNCTIHGIRTMASHPDLRKSEYAMKILKRIKDTPGSKGSSLEKWWSGSNLFAAIQAISKLDVPAKRDIVGEALKGLVSKQRKNGTFGTPFQIERVTAVLMAISCLRGGENGV